MKGSAQAATAIAVGYFLGRHRKFRTAAMMAAATTVGSTTVGGMLMKRGMKILGSSQALEKISPQLGEITDIVRGDLLIAGKAAITAAAANRVDTLTDSLHERAERVRNPEAMVAEGADKAAQGADKAADVGRKAAGAGSRAAAGTAKRGTSTASSAGGAARRLAGRGKAEPDETETEADDYEDDYDTQDGYEGDEYEDDREDAPEDERDDERDDEEPAPRRPAARRRPAVSRARR